MAQIVEKGDWIKFNPDSKKEETIKWQQDLGSRQEQYIALAYSVQDKEASGSLFIQLGVADSFFQKCQKDESRNPLVDGGYKIQVYEAFQYGQNNEKTLRFLSTTIRLISHTNIDSLRPLPFPTSETRL